MSGNREDVAGSGRDRRVYFLGNHSGNADTSADRQRRRTTKGSSSASETLTENKYLPPYFDPDIEFYPLSHTRPTSPEVFPNHKVIRMYRLNPDGSFIYSSSSEEEDEGDRPKESLRVKKEEKKREADAQIAKKSQHRFLLPKLEFRTFGETAPPK